MRRALEADQQWDIRGTRETATWLLLNQPQVLSCPVNNSKAALKDECSRHLGQHGQLRWKGKTRGGKISELESQNPWLMVSTHPGPLQVSKSPGAQVPKNQALSLWSQIYAC